MKLEDSDIRKLVNDANYQFIVDETRFGIQPNRPAIFFPNALDYFIKENSDEEHILWIPRKGNEELLYEIESSLVRDDKRLLYKIRKNRGEE